MPVASAEMRCGVVGRSSGSAARLAVRVEGRDPTCCRITGAPPLRTPPRPRRRLVRRRGPPRAKSALGGARAVLALSSVGALKLTATQSRRFGGRNAFRGLTRRPRGRSTRSRPGLTALTEAHGDDDAADLAVDFARRVRDSVAGCDGEFVKTTEDAVMVRIDAAAPAVGLDLEIVRGLMRTTASPMCGPACIPAPPASATVTASAPASNLAARIARSLAEASSCRPRRAPTRSGTWSSEGQGAEPSAATVAGPSVREADRTASRTPAGGLSVVHPGHPVVLGLVLRFLLGRYVAGG